MFFFIDGLAMTLNKIQLFTSEMSATLKLPVGRSSVSVKRCRNVRVTAIAEVLESGSKDFKVEVPAGLNKFSSRITQPKSQGASQAMLYATGLNEDDMNKPQASSSSFYMISANAMHHRWPSSIWEFPIGSMHYQNSSSSFSTIQHQQ